MVVSDIITMYCSFYSCMLVNFSNLTFRCLLNFSNLMFSKKSSGILAELQMHENLHKNVNANFYGHLNNKYVTALHC